MSGVSSAELILLVVLGLVVLGPKRLPEIANKIGSWVGQARRMTRIMRRQLEAELNLDDFNTIQPPKITKQAAPAPADDAITDHIPSDDDTYSPLHEEESADEESEQEKPE
jgi:Tat protein translocase TatB subunit